MKVKKRDNSIEVFQIERVRDAIAQAFQACERRYDESVLKCVMKKFKRVKEDDVIDLEDIQDTIEECLMMYSPEIAKHFIIYRHEHAVLRDKYDKLTKKVEKKLLALEIENQNANVDEYSFGGRMGEAMRVVTKDYALNHCMSKKSKKNNENNEIYIHDLDSYSVGEHNCAEYNSWIKIIDGGMPKVIRIGELGDQLGLGVNQIADVQKRGIHILSRDGWTKLINISCRETSDDEPLYTLRTRKGMPITLTGKHRLPIVRNGAEIIEEVKNIKVGDELIDIDGITLSSEEYASDFIDLTQLNDDKVDIRIINLDHLRRYLRYKYGAQFAEIYKKNGYSLDSNALSMKLHDFLDLMDKYPITYDVMSMLRIKSCGSKHNFPLHIPYSADLAKLYAYIYADGGVYVDEDKKLFQLTFTNKKKEMVIDFIDTFERVFGYRPGLQKPGSWPEYPNNVVYRTTSSSRILCKMFKDFAGARKYGVADISMPDFVLNGNESIKYAYLSAALDTDGCLGYKITYSSCCKRYCEQLKLMLEGMGYHPSVVQSGKAGDVYRFGTKSGFRNFDSYNVLINRNDEIAKIYENIDTFKRNDSYVYKGFNNKFNENKITSISVEFKGGTKVYDVETGDHWFIVNNIVSHNCLSIPFDQLLNDSFNTRQTDVRPANSINTAMQLAAVLFQLQSLQQFGGVSATHLDWTMVPFVRKSFYKHYRDGLEYILGKDIETLGVEPTTSIDSDAYKKEKKVYKYALDLTERELKQAVEGLYHNLNTLQSRSGNQLPFTSINYGTCTLPEGRMVIKALLMGSINGVGKYHKTPIFPCGIFQCKEGVNRHKGDPNYDLFRLALKSTAQRIYPNYANCDAPMQKEWVAYDREMKNRVINELSDEDKEKLISRLKENPTLCDKLFLTPTDNGLEIQKEEKPFEIFSTMGCVDGEEVITYKFRGQLFVESFRRMWLRLTDYFDQQEQIDGVPDHLYMDVNGVEIYDSQNGFVNVKRVIRNTSNSWVELKLSKGRLLKCTNNHPLPTNRGVICAENLQKGDILYSSKKQPIANDLTYNIDKAWLLGFIMCDGCYDGYVTSTIAFSGEDDIQEAYINRMYDAFNNKVKVKEQHRSHKGNYKELICTEKNTWIIDYLSTKFEGLTKNRRHIPNEVFLWSKEARLSFLAGIIDADGYINPTTHGGSVVQIGSVNKELSLQQLALVLSLDMDGCVYKNEFNKQKGSVRYRVEFHPTEELLGYIVCKKKTDNFIERKTLSATVDNTLGQDLTVYDIIFTNGDNYSYDVETENGYFDVSGIWSHNCRTVNGADINAEISYRNNIRSIIDSGKIIDTILSAAQKDGRGNICPVTIILPTLAMEADRDVSRFLKLLNKKIYEAKDMLIERFDWIAKQNPLSAKFMWENNTMSGYIPKEGTRSGLRHGTIVIGQLGMAETLQLLLGQDHTTKVGMDLAKEIENIFKTRCAEFKKEYNLNFGVYYTPAENLCHTALKKFRAKYGVIEKVSDKDFFTNSMHVPVWHELTPFEKIDIEAQLVGYSSAGCITYVELDSGVKHNIDAMEEIVSYAMDKGIPYFAINVPIDDCNDCGYSDEMGDVCPQCGSRNISRLRRCTGYLSGDYKSSFNQGKQEEVEHRVKHIREIVV